MAVDRFPCLVCFLLRRRQQKIRIVNSANAARPPSTPPIIAPRFEDAAFGMLVGVADEETPRWVAARTEDEVTPVVPEEVDSSVLVEGSEVEDETGACEIPETLGVTTPVDEAIKEADCVVDGTSETVVASVKVVTEEVVVVLGVTLGNLFTVPAVVSDDSETFVVALVVSLVVSSSLSGHIPVVQGSLEQHPRKSPAVQTYHCVPPVQVLLVSRGKRMGESILGVSCESLSERRDSTANPNLNLVGA